MQKKWNLLPVAGGVSLVVWVIFLFFAGQGAGSNFSHGYGNTPDWRWLGDLLLFFGSVGLVVGMAAGLLFQYGVRGLRTDGMPLRRVLSIVPLLAGVLVWLATASFIFLGASLLATG